MRQKHVQVVSVFFLILTFGLAFFKWNDLSIIYTKIGFGWALLGFGCYLVNHVFRGIRLKMIVGQSMKSYKQAFCFSSFHGFFSYLLPFRTGDFSLPVLLKSAGKTDFKTGVGILVKTRLMDFSMLGFFSILGSFFIAGKISPVIQIIWFVSGLLLMISWIIFQKLGSFTTWIIKKKFLNLEIDISAIFKLQWSEFFVTFLIWLGVYASQYFMIKSIGLDLRLPEIIFLSAVQLPLQMLPVQGLANSGNHEGGWITSMVLLGFNTQDALKFALASHGVLIAYVALLGLVAVFMGYHKKLNHHKRGEIV
ncbi:MAG: flippase-like domain-containing protein [Desulfobacterales bacterium]|nr:flippase-like domain-containing protein [Desulfobacterales bacterium]